MSADLQAGVWEKLFRACVVEDMLSNNPEHACRTHLFFFDSKFSDGLCSMGSRFCHRTRDATVPRQHTTTTKSPLEIAEVENRSNSKKC